MNKQFSIQLIVCALCIGVFSIFSGHAQSDTAIRPYFESIHHSDDPPAETIRLVLDAYLDLKDALVKSDAEEASLAASKMVDGLENHEGDLAVKIKKEAGAIVGLKDVNLQRKHFSPLSDNMYELVKKSGANKDTLYRQYCPMAFGGEGGYWLSAEEEVLNPYFGDRMLHCGSVEETIPPGGK